MNPSFYKPLTVGTDGSGILFFSELDFCASRLYWLAGPSDERGGHAHKQLRQSFVCISGSASVALTDGLKKEVAKLSAGQAVTISPGLWRDIYPLSEGDVLLVMASDNYDESDYIRDFDEFRRWKVA